MAKSVKKYVKRVQFPSGGQKRFLEKVQLFTGLPVNELAGVVNVHPRSYRDWKREKLNMSLPAVRELSRISGIDLPSDIEVLEPFWYVNKGAQKAWDTLQRRYGGMVLDEEYRKKKWREWWMREGKHRQPPYFYTIPVRKPPYSSALAEFTGIMMGDGGITKRQVKITVHSEDDKEYANYLKNLIARLFHVQASLFFRRHEKAVSLVVSRTELVKYCHDYLELKVGNKLKQGLDIPSWISSKLEFQKACLRGLVDTDGCIFYERHNIQGKIYSYPRLNFTSASIALRKSVFDIFTGLGFSPRMRKKDGVYKCVQLENRNEIRQYFEAVGTHNQKHQQRFFSG